MSGAVRLYGAYLSVALRSRLQYPVSCLMQLTGALLITAGQGFGIWVLFRHFPALQGWALDEVALLYGLVNVSFAVGHAAARGFERLYVVLKQGDFDRLLLRPRSTALQVLGADFRIASLGRLLLGGAILAWAVAETGLALSFLRLLYLGAVLAGGVCLFTALFVLEGALSFWTVETLELVHVVTYGGVNAAQYPITIYDRWLRDFFTFIVPLTCINYLPVGLLLDHQEVRAIPVLLLWGSPLAGVLFLFVSLCLWRVGERRYMSTGS